MIKLTNICQEARGRECGLIRTRKRSKRARFRLGGTRQQVCNPRRARRGYMLPIAALGLTIWAFALSQVSQILIQEVRQARAEALATLISDLAADFDLYVHQNRTTLAGLLTGAPDEALALTGVDLSTFVSGGAAGSWRMPVAGLNAASGSNVLSIAHLDLTLAIARADTSGTPLGLLTLEAQPDAPAHLLADLTAALTRRSADAGKIGVGDASVYATSLLGRSLAANDLILATPRYSGLNPALLLREARVGHEVMNQMETALDFVQTGGLPAQSIGSIAKLQADTLSAGRAGCLGSATTCLSAPGTTLTQDVTLDALTVTDALTVHGRSTAGNAGFKAGTLTVGTALTSVEAFARDSSNTGLLKATGTLTAGSVQATTATMAEFAASQASVALSDADTGSRPARLSATRATIPTLGAELARVNRAIIGQGATQLTPAPLSTGQLAAINAQFGSITTSGGCQGC